MINHCATNWDYPGHFHFLRPGTMVPFIPGGMDHNLAEVLGMVREGEQYLLMIRTVEAVNGQYVQVRRVFQRDRETIEGLYRDARRTEFRLRVLRHKDG